MKPICTDCGAIIPDGSERCGNPSCPGSLPASWGRIGDFSDRPSAVMALNSIAGLEAETARFNKERGAKERRERRDKFAAAALTGLLTEENDSTFYCPITKMYKSVSDASAVAAACVVYADALIAALAVPKESTDADHA